MPLIDTQSYFSKGQAITGDAASANVVDLGLPGTPKHGVAPLTQDFGDNIVLLQGVVEETFDALTSLDVQIQMDTVEAFSSPTVLLTVNYLLAQLVKGFVMPEINVLPGGVTQRYLRAYYNVNGTDPTVGKITLGVVQGRQTNVH